MKVMSSEDMRRLDENCKFFGIDTLRLMENAGRAVADAVKDVVKDVCEGRKVAVFAGYGNNGGDALVAARHIPFDVDVFLVGTGEMGDEVR
ncbi:hypothetical protein DRN72_02890 [Methanosarcinales archaeon]|nr:MAG: hypothetical protein DRN72_02890 [Methanosarcinales archaeon]